MNPGRLRDEIVIQTPSLTVQANGQALTTWSTYATRLAKVTTPSVSQFLGASREIQQGANPRTMRQNRWLVQVRHDPDVSSAMRVRWLDHTLDIEGITADPQNAVYMFLHCLETVPASQGFGELEASPAMVVTIGGTEYETGDTYDFGDLVAGVDGEATMTVENAGEEATSVLALATPTISGHEQFAIGSEPAAIVGVGETTTVTIAVTNPADTTPGDYTAMLSVETNDPEIGTFELVLTYACVEQ